jgi:hypothetical protein
VLLEVVGINLSKLVGLLDLAFVVGSPRMLGSSPNHLKKLKKKSENYSFFLPKFLRIDPENCIFNP